jgi:hypothetical protein
MKNFRLSGVLRSKLFHLASICLGLCIGAATDAAASAALPLGEVLKRYEAATSLPDRVTFTTSEAVREAILKPPSEQAPERAGGPLVKYVETIRFARDGDRLDIRQEKVWDPSSGTDKVVPRDPATHTVIDEISVADTVGVHVLTHSDLLRVGRGHEHRIIVSGRPASLDETLMRLRGERTLDGCPVLTNGNHIARLIKDGTEKSITIETDSASGHQIYTVGAQTPYGRCVVWLDADNDFCPIRIEIRKAAADIFAFGNVRLGARGIKELLQVSDKIGAERIGGRPFLTGCQTVATVTLQSGEVRQTTSSIQRDDIDFNPQFGPEAFKISAPAGTPVSVVGNVSGIAYEWRDGKVMAAYDPRLVADINAAVKSVPPFGKTGVRAGTTWMVLLVLAGVAGVLGSIVVYRRSISSRPAGR